MADENVRKANLKVLENVRNSLIKNRFNCEVFENRNDAFKFIVSLIGSGKRVGLGGSMTVSELGILDEISKHNKIFKHSHDMDSEERRKVWLNAIDSDFYLASPQAVTLDGKLIFIDGTGNRCAALTWGPRHLVIIAGVNKIVKDEQEGFWRMRNIAAIRNNIRLNKKNPCVMTGKCEDCSSADRICNIVTVIWKRPKVTDITVVLVNEELGY